MNLDEERESENVEDRRGIGRGGLAIGGGIGTLLVAVLALVFGGDPQQLFSGGHGPAGNPSPQSARAPRPPEDGMTRLVRRGAPSTEDGWGATFKPAGGPHPP